jgi:hypothetical protein
MMFVCWRPRKKEVKENRKKERKKERKEERKKGRNFDRGMKDVRYLLLPPALRNSIGGQGWSAKKMRVVTTDPIAPSSTDFLTDM